MFRTINFINCTSTFFEDSTYDRIIIKKKTVTFWNVLILHKNEIKI